MKIVVIGGTGLIGTQLCNRLREEGHDVLPASPNTGVNTITGEGLQAALQGADVVVDVANSPSFEDAAVLEFFQTSGRNLFAAEKAAGVKHHVALSVVGTERMLDSGYFRGKMAQEQLIKESGVPYSILRATQFFEFIGPIAHSGAQGDTIRLTSAALQPVASADVAAALAKIAVAAPSNQTAEVAGPTADRWCSFVRSLSAAHQGSARSDCRRYRHLLRRADQRPVADAGGQSDRRHDHFEAWLKSGSGPSADRQDQETSHANPLSACPACTVCRMALSAQVLTAAPPPDVKEVCPRASRLPRQGSADAHRRVPAGGADPVHRHDAQVSSMCSKARSSWGRWQEAR